MLIAFEGIDGSGKGTQSRALLEILKSSGKSCDLFSFPNYSKTFFGKETGNYLNGLYGGLSDLPPQFPAMLYAMDRFETKEALQKAIADNEFVICDRYTSSNCAYQAAKLPDNKRKDFISWVEKIEYGILELPEPDLTFFLDLPPSLASGLVLHKGERIYTRDKKDIHEKDDSYMSEVYRVYKSFALRSGWVTVECSRGGEILDPIAISRAIASHLGIR